jgi:hypothetical protein
LQVPWPNGRRGCNWGRELSWLAVSKHGSHTDTNANLKVWRHNRKPGVSSAKSHRGLPDHIGQEIPLLAGSLAQRKARVQLGPGASWLAVSNRGSHTDSNASLKGWRHNPKPEAWATASISL